MTLDSYTNLVRNLPYLDQAFETRSANWQQHKEDKIFSNFYERSFHNDKLKLSRRDLFNVCKKDFNDAIFSIIFWGYPRNMRGNSFQTIIQKFSKIQSALSIHKDLSESEFKQICDKLKATGIGLSTLSKFLYFFEFKIVGHPCLIFDSRIIDVMNDENGFKELHILTQNGKITESNKRKKYVGYLQLMADISRKNDYKPDQLELFLFSMGKNLKPLN
jgi:hypothetical protein